MKRLLLPPLFILSGCDLFAPKGPVGVVPPDQFIELYKK